MTTTDTPVTVEGLQALYQTHLAWPVGKHPRNGGSSEEWEPYYAANRAREALLEAFPALLAALASAPAGDAFAAASKPIAADGMGERCGAEYNHGTPYGEAREYSRMPAAVLPTGGLSTAFRYQATEASPGAKIGDWLIGAAVTAENATHFMVHSLTVVPAKVEEA